MTEQKRYNCGWCGDRGCKHCSEYRNTGRKMLSLVDCDFPDCKLTRCWYNANGAACNDHALWLSTIDGGNDVVVPLVNKESKWTHGGYL